MSRAQYLIRREFFELESGKLLCRVITQTNTASRYGWRVEMFRLHKKYNNFCANVIGSAVKKFSALRLRIFSRFY